MGLACRIIGRGSQRFSGLHSRATAGETEASEFAGRNAPEAFTELDEAKLSVLHHLIDGRPGDVRRFGKFSDGIRDSGTGTGLTLRRRRCLARGCSMVGMV